MFVHQSGSGSMSEDRSLEFAARNFLRSQSNHFEHWRKNMKKFQTTFKIGFALAAACGLLLAMSIWPSAQKATGAALNGNPTAAAAIRVSVAFTIAKKSTNCT